MSTRNGRTKSGKPDQWHDPLEKAIQSTGVDPDACIGLSVGEPFTALWLWTKKQTPTGIMTWADGRQLNVKEIYKYDMHEHYLR
jgi:hypothetical protein